MPELPEVQTVIDCLRPHLVGKELEYVEAVRTSTVEDLRQDAAPFGRISTLGRRGKYILIYTTSGVAVVVHLRMTGKLLWQVPEERRKYVRAIFHFADGSSLYFDDVRSFGTIRILPESGLKKLDEKLGMEPLEKTFDGAYLKNILSKRSGPIKNILLDQHAIAGLGNIYACEALYRAAIAPTRPGKSLTAGEASRLADVIRTILHSAIQAGGTTVADYRSSNGKDGAYQQQLLVYKQTQCRCGAPVLRIKQAGRSTFYCEKCQK